MAEELSYRGRRNIYVQVGKMSIILLRHHTVLWIKYEDECPDEIGTCNIFLTSGGGVDLDLMCS